MDRVGDGVEQVGLAQTGLPVDVEGVIAVPWIIGHRPGGGMGKFVGGAHHEALKGVLLRSRDQIVFFRLLVSVKLPLGEHSHLKFGGEQLPQGVLDAGANVIVAGSAVFKNDAAANTREFLEIFSQYQGR